VPPSGIDTVVVPAPEIASVPNRLVPDAAVLSYKTTDPLAEAEITTVISLHGPLIAAPSAVTEVSVDGFN
jgi:hypothetical protein